MLINEYYCKRRDPGLAYVFRKEYKAGFFRGDAVKKKTHLHYLGLSASRVHHVNQIWLEAEGSQAGRFEGLPPVEDEVKVPPGANCVNLELHLADGEVSVGVRIDE
jgi:hypothetical protein